MPGHIKKTSGPDPDPSPWLEVKPELKTKLKAKPYDPKKSYWVPGPKGEGGYLEGMLESKEGGKFDCSEDMADLTYLGDPCVLWNSVVRYKNEMI